MENETKHEPLYPILHSDTYDIREKLSFRINKITDIQTIMERNISERRDLDKKYSKISKTIGIIEVFLSSSAIGMGSVGILFLSSIVGSPVSMGLEIGAIITGSSSIVFKFINKKILKKIEKHREIKILAQAKLNTILEMISKAIKDGRITDDEFNLILNEYNKFLILKETVREKTKYKSNPTSNNNFYSDIKSNMDNIQLLLQKKETLRIGEYYQKN